MTPLEFSKEIMSNKEVKIYEFIFRLNNENKIEVTNTLKNICDVERYKTPSQAYFVYSYTLKQLDSRKQRNYKKQKITYGSKTAKFKEFVK